MPMDVYQKLAHATQEVVADTTVTARERQVKVKRAFKDAGLETEMAELAAMICDDDEAPPPKHK